MSLDTAYARVARTDRILSACETAEQSCALAIDLLLDELCAAGIMPHGFDGSMARTELCKQAALEAVRVVIAEANAPNEVRFLYGDEQ